MNYDSGTGTEKFDSNRQQPWCGQDIGLHFERIIYVDILIFSIPQNFITEKKNGKMSWKKWELMHINHVKSQMTYSVSMFSHFLFFFSYPLIIILYVLYPTTAKLIKVLRFFKFRTMTPTRPGFVIVCAAAGRSIAVGRWIPGTVHTARPQISMIMASNREVL